MGADDNMISVKSTNTKGIWSVEKSTRNRKDAPSLAAISSKGLMSTADEYPEAGDRVQTSEKGWGTVAEAFRSIAEERGRNRQSNRILNDVAYQLTEE